VRVLYEKGVATHFGPESCAGDREVVSEVLTGGRASQVMSREIPVEFRVPPPSRRARGNTWLTDSARSVRALRGRRPCARTEAPHAGTGRSRDWPSGEMDLEVRGGNPKGGRHR
jgi:hypothetical protein